MLQVEICSVVFFLSHFPSLGIWLSVSGVGFSSSSCSTVAASCTWLVQLNSRPVLIQTKNRLRNTTGWNRVMISDLRAVTLFRSRSLFPPSSFLLSLAGFSGFSVCGESGMFSPFFFSKALSFLTSSSRFLKELSPSWCSLLLRRSSSCRLKRSLSFCRRSFSRSRSRSLSRSVSRSLNSFRPSSSPLWEKHKLDWTYKGPFSLYERKYWATS